MALERKRLQEQSSLLPIVTTWIGHSYDHRYYTRQCLGLSLFIAGSHVTAEMVVAALRVLLPADLQFLISDRDIHCTADVFQRFAKKLTLSMWLLPATAHNRMELQNVLSAPFKEWLAYKAWQSDKQLLEFIQ
jgi:hypothetical protein